MFRAKDCPKHVELLLEVNKLSQLHLVGSTILVNLHNQMTQDCKMAIENLQMKLIIMQCDTTLKQGALETFIPRPRRKIFSDQVLCIHNDRNTCSTHVCV